ncbi:asparagine synthase [Winogradskyella sp. PC-19]|uniref:asparagine synthase-related protein n=1 Tax=unclassified Winogradskyella TaxID=2615021 RepID=UPI000B3C090C|nr:MULTISPECIES: asparagine synthase-related protein [unclassified Winogradskyella]ARV08953.1 asparagine synthase [Winogradskyella sp. PC-19]
MQIKSPIIPIHQIEVNTGGDSELDYKAICIFAAIGFFLEDDTYFTNRKVLRPATENTLLEENKLQKSESYFNWHYTPRNITFSQALDEFATLFETIVKEQTDGKKVILPLSGGLDSRSQAAALKHLNADVSSYSYEFINGYAETKLAKKIAEVCNFNFEAFEIKKGYLWDKINDLAQINKCYSDFTSSRQMAVIEQFSKMGDVFSLGHWGDVLFDNYNLDNLSHKEQVQLLTKKLLKRGGLDFAEQLWQSWHLKGDFKLYLHFRLSESLNKIDIENTNARLRAFKSKYWAPRWTSVNLSVFKEAKPITLPYYDDRMCEFICTIPEDYLAGRKIQIEYIKQRNPELANVIWQDKRPYNLFNYNNKNHIKTWSYKINNKITRSFKSVLGKQYVQRNWELQFLGEENKKKLLNTINESSLSNLIPKPLIQKYLKAFYNEDALNNAHALNMLLVLAKFNQNSNFE